MAKSIQSNRRDHSKAGNRKSRKRRGKRHQPHRPRGELGARVKRVGGERFALVCVDPAKNRSEWRMADYFGNVLIEPRTMEHEAKHFQLAVLLARRAQEQHGIEDLIMDAPPRTHPAGRPWMDAPPRTHPAGRRRNN